MKQKVITTQEASEIDQKTRETLGCTALDLIRKAGEALEKAFLDHFRPRRDERIGIFSGSGHNGADALVLGELLFKKGYDVSFVVLSEGEKLKPENREIISEIEESGGKILRFHEESHMGEIKSLIGKSDYVIDGIFGTGLKNEVTGFLRMVIEALSEARNLFSIDIPSGISGDSGLALGAAVRADYTAVIEHYKVGNLLNQAADHHGKKEIIKIGLMDAQSNRDYLSEESILPLPKRKNHTHKYDYGNLLIIGGSPEMTGAPVLAALAALRTGAGLATVALPKEALPYLKQLPPEIMARYYGDFSEFHPFLEKKNACAFGPGLGKKNPFSEAILGELIETGLPTVIDADGINYLKKFSEEGAKFPNVVMTPHLGELAQFLGSRPAELEKRSLEVLEELAERHECTVVLKGPCTLIANKNEVWFVDAPNPGLATAGSGDVLTGVIVSLLGQGFPLLEAAKTGVYLHALAGRLAKEKYGEAGLIAGDIIAFLPEAIKKIT